MTMARRAADSHQESLVAQVIRDQVTILSHQEGRHRLRLQEMNQDSRGPWNHLAVMDQEVREGKQGQTPFH